jgi:hypothetical protein
MDRFGSTKRSNMQLDRFSIELVKQGVVSYEPEEQFHVSTLVLKLLTIDYYAICGMFW